MRLLGTQRHMWEDNIKQMLNRVWGGVDWVKCLMTESSSSRLQCDSKALGSVTQQAVSHKILFPWIGPLSKQTEHLVSSITWHCFMPQKSVCITMIRADQLLGCFKTAVLIYIIQQTVGT